MGKQERRLPVEFLVVERRVESRPRFKNLVKDN